MRLFSIEINPYRCQDLISISKTYANFSITDKLSRIGPTIKLNWSEWLASNLSHDLKLLPKRLIMELVFGVWGRWNSKTEILIRMKMDIEGEGGHKEC